MRMLYFISGTSWTDGQRFDAGGILRGGISITHLHMAHSMASTRRFDWRDWWFSLKSGQHANDPRSRRMNPKNLQFQLHGGCLLLTEQKTCSYMLELAHIRLRKEFTDILKLQHLSRHNIFLYFLPAFLVKIHCSRSSSNFSICWHMLCTTHLGKQATNQSGPDQFNPWRLSWSSDCIDPHLLDLFKGNHYCQSGWQYPSGDLL